MGRQEIPVPPIEPPSRRVAELDKEIGESGSLMKALEREQDLNTPEARGELKREIIRLTSAVNQMRKLLTSGDVPSDISAGELPGFLQDKILKMQSEFERMEEEA